MKQLKMTAMAVMVWSMAGLVPALGQVVVHSNAFPHKGDQFEIAYTNFSPYNFPKSPFNTDKDTFISDLSGIPIDSMHMEKMGNPEKAPGGTAIVGATMVFQSALGYSFSLIRDSNLSVVGITPTLSNFPSLIGFQFDKPISHLSAPIRFGEDHLDSTLTTKNLGLATVKVAVKSYYEVNGHGILKTKYGSYKVLRIRRKYDFVIRTKPIVGEELVETGSYVNWEFYAPNQKWPIFRAATILDDIGGGRQDTFVRFEILAKSWVGIHDDNRSKKIGSTQYETGNLMAIIASDDVESIDIYTIDGRKIQTLKPDGVPQLQQGVYILIVRKRDGDCLHLKYGVAY